MPTGAGGGRVRVLDAGPVDAWVETVAARSIAPSIDAARAHDAVVMAALDTGLTPLPARFNQIFETDDRCRAALADATPRITEDLARVSGLVEMRIIVRLSAPVPKAPAPGSDQSPGTAYMRRLLQKRELEQIMQTTSVAVRRRLTETVGAFVRGEAVTLDPLPAAVLTLSHLVAREEVESYRAALRDTAAGVDIERLVVSGPLAPYQFVSAADD
jgi:hypothetical protein